MHVLPRLDLFIALGKVAAANPLMSPGRVFARLWLRFPHNVGEIGTARGLRRGTPS
jgi:hypothetical protein